MNNIQQAQILLHQWIGNFEKRSYVQIKEACVFLNSSLELELGEHPVWELFHPLLLSGAVDHIGKEYYALTKPVALLFDSTGYLINMSGEMNENLPVGYSNVDICSIPKDIRPIRMNSLSVLKSFPSVDAVIDSWEKSYIDGALLSYHNYKNRIGVAEQTTGTVKFFSIPDKLYIKEIPSRAINPDAYNIAMTYERVLNGDGNGFYRKSEKELYMRKFAIPILIYRALALDGMAIKSFPTAVGDYFLFKNVSQSVVKEINRIFCKSVRYE